MAVKFDPILGKLREADPVGESAIGNEVTDGTAGSILFVGAGPVLAQDNANLFYDASNDRLGIGVVDPDSKVEVLATTTQQKWSYDADSFAKITVADSSNTTIETGETGTITLADSAGTYAVVDNIGSATVTGGQIAVVGRKMAITSTTVGDFDGDVVYFGTGTTVLGKIYHFKSDGSWELADANTVANCDGLLAVALGTSATTHGMLLRGMATIAAIQGTEAVGDILYLSESATGEADCVAPAGSGDIVRIIGYCLHATNKTIWFNPDSTFVELA
jgi:hypothetical protein